MVKPDKAKIPTQLFKVKYRPLLVTVASLQTFRKLPRDNMLIVVLLFAVIGSFALLQSRAATPVISTEPEAGTISDGAAAIQDGNASGGGAVRFGVSTPVVPANVQAYTGGNSIALLWNPSEGSTPATSYNVFRGGVKIGTATPKAPALVYAKGTRYIDTTITPGSAYSYQVQAVSASGQTSILSPAMAVTAPSSTTGVPIVTANTTAAPDIANWLDTVAIPELIIWYPKMGDRLAFPSYTPRTNFTIVAVNGLANPGVAYPAEGRIEVSPDWIRSHPEDAGMLIHEATHILQNYNNAPFWVTEGVADWVRAYFYHDQNLSLPTGANDIYTMGYGKSAYFLEWMQSQNNPDLIKNLHIAAHNGTYSKTWLATATGKSPDQQWSAMTGKNVITALIKMKNVDNRCVDNLSSQFTNGNAVHVYGCSGGEITQEWSRLPQTNSTYTLQLRGKCMDVTDGGTTNGTKIQIWDCDGSGDQRWAFNANGTISNPQSGKCLSNPAGTGFSVQLDIQTCNTADSKQLWTFPFSL